MTSKAIGLAGKVLGLVFTLVFATLIVSQAFRGPVSMVMVEGSSMRPTYRGGDLVLVLRAGSYAAGDVVAYRSRRLGSVVLHRIVARDGEGLVLKGDDNGWLDPERPTAGAVLGKHLVRVPRVGGVLEWLRTPRGIAVVAGASVSFMLVNAGTRRRKRRRRAAALPAKGAIPGAARFLRVPRFTATGFVVVCAVAGVLGVMGVATTGAVTTTAPYEHSGSFAYAAKVEAGPVYQKPAVATGDPVYLNLTPSLTVEFRYRFRSETIHDLGGRANLVAEVADETGWRHRIVLQPERRFAGDEVLLRGTLDLKGIRRVIDSFERLTGIRGSVYVLTVSPEIHTIGTLGGRSFDEAFSPKLAYRMERLLLRLAPASGSSEDPALTAQDPLHPSAQGTVETTAAAPVRVAGVRLDAGMVRRASLAGIVVAILGVACLLARRRPMSRRDDEAARILRRYRQWIIPVRNAPTGAPGASPVEVASIESLLRLADRYERVVLHCAEKGTSSFVIEDDGTLYRYRPEGSEQTHAPALGREAGNAVELEPLTGQALGGGRSA